MRTTQWFDIRLPMLCGAAIALALPGCQQRTDASPTASAPEPTATADATSPVTGTAAGTGSADKGPRVAKLTVSSAGVDSPYIADSAGGALYLLQGDDRGRQCTDACLQTWPPMLLASVEARPEVAARLQADLVGTLQRPDGTVQLTYNEHPVYRYAVDDGAGSIAGHALQDQWGQWFLVTPEGAPLALEDPQP